MLLASYLTAFAFDSNIDDTWHSVQAVHVQARRRGLLTFPSKATTPLDLKLIGAPARSRCHGHKVTGDQRPAYFGRSQINARLASLNSTTAFHGQTHLQLFAFRLVPSKSQTLSCRTPHSKAGANVVSIKFRTESSTMSRRILVSRTLQICTQLHHDALLCFQNRHQQLPHLCHRGV